MLRRLIPVLLLFFLLPSFVFAQEEILEGRVVEVIESKEENGQFFQKLEVLVTKGTLKDKRVVVKMGGKFSKVGQPVFKKGDEVLLSYSKTSEGKEVVYITEFVRKYSLFWLFIIFISLTALVARWRGLNSLLGMGISFLIIIKFILPQILSGRDPVLIVILGSLFIVPLTFYLSHGFNKKTTVAILATLISLGVTALLARLFIKGAKLTGFASEEAAFLQVARGETINIKGLLLAGIIIGSLGILDDITISQAAVVDQLKQASPGIFPQELFSRAMNVGQDHIASMVNTLILVYTGAALPLLLLFVQSPHPFSEVINYEIIAEEVVRSLVSSIGLILAVPVTTFLAAYFSKK